MKTYISKIHLTVCMLVIGSFYTPLAYGKIIKSFDAAPVVGKYVSANSSEVLSVDYAKFKDTAYIALSTFVENMEIVRLDNSDDALIGGGRTTISDNYILISNNRQSPYKLFDKKGKYITDIGGYGQGPNEYQHTYSEQLDEENNRIYILPWSSDKILVFDLKGNALDPIPLLTMIPKGHFYVDTKKETVTCTMLPFEGYPLVWVQTFQKKLLQDLFHIKYLATQRSYSNEVYMGRNTSAYDIMVMVIDPDPRPDSLYHYNRQDNKLLPVFTMNFPAETAHAWHAYYETPNHFWGHISIPFQDSEETVIQGKTTYYVVDKKTLKGCYYKLYNDFLGDNTLRCGSYFHNGYFIQNSDPMDLREKLEKMLKNNPKLEKDKLKKVQDLINSIDENDNNIILKARLKGYKPLR